MNPYRTPQIENNWWRIVLYLVVCIVSIVVCSIPVVAFFWDFIQEQNSDVIGSNLPYMFAIQLTMSFGIVGASWLMVKEIEYRTFHFYRLTFKRVCCLMVLRLVLSS